MSPAPSTATDVLIEDDAHRVLREVSEKQRLLAILHAPMFRPPFRVKRKRVRVLYLLLFPILAALLLSLLWSSLGNEGDGERGFQIGMVVFVAMQAIYLDVRRRIDALVALLEQNGTIGFEQEPVG